MIDKAEAIALRIYPFSTTSHVIVWLTPDRGRLVTTAKGAQRPRSVFLGQYDSFYTCEILFYAREINSLHVLKECEPFETRPRLRSDWRATAMASYACDMIARVALDHHPQEELYNLLTTGLNFAATAGARPPLLLWFDLALLGTLGFTPRLDRCAACEAPITEGRSGIFSASRGGVLCPGCVPPGDITARAIAPPVLAMLRQWQDAQSPRAANNTRCSREQLLDAFGLLGDFLKYHLDTAPPSRYTALEILMFDERT